MSKYHERYIDILREDAVDTDLSTKVIAAAPFYEMLQDVMMESVEEQRAQGEIATAEIIENDVALVRCILCLVPPIGAVPDQN